ncbi:MAG: hypothetical protein ACXWKG_07595, partial [Limisphaerales bacterium]
PDILEKRLQSWSPRQPSDKVARVLFEGGAAAEPRARTEAPHHWRGIELWNWLTPVAACCLTVVVLCSGNSRRPLPYPSRDNATFFATLMIDATSSNVSSQTFTLSKADENIEWNVWPHATWRTTNFSSAQRELRPTSNSINGIYP